jgi:hypothetical protein
VVDVSEQDIAQDAMIPTRIRIPLALSMLCSEADSRNQLSRGRLVTGFSHAAGSRADLTRGQGGPDGGDLGAA